MDPSDKKMQLNRVNLNSYGTSEFQVKLNLYYKASN